MYGNIKYEIYDSNDSYKLEHDKFQALMTLEKRAIDNNKKQPSGWPGYSFYDLQGKDGSFKVIRLSKTLLDEKTKDINEMDFALQFREGGKLYKYQYGGKFHIYNIIGAIYEAVNDKDERSLNKPIFENHSQVLILNWIPHCDGTFEQSNIWLLPAWACKYF